MDVPSTHRSYLKRVALFACILVVCAVIGLYLGWRYETEKLMNVDDDATTTDESGDVTWKKDRDGGYWIANTTSGSNLYATVLMPNAVSEFLQPLVLVPGGIGTSGDFLAGQKKDAQTLADAGYLVVAFDPEGRGRSEGEEDNNGSIGQDGLAAIVRFASEQSGGQDVGVISFSYGITLASGAIARYPDLPVAFLIDWEGPADRNDTGGCDVDKTGHLSAIADCDDEAFWSEREAMGFIDDVTVPYLRLQTERDHAQPDVLSAIRMVNAAVGGKSPWVRLNDELENQACAETSPPDMLPDAFDRTVMTGIAKYAKTLFVLSRERE